MDVQQKLDEIVATVGGARSMPMSASCVVNRAELLAMLDEVREALPGSLAQAREVLGGREQMVEEARREAQRIVETAEAERGSMVSGTEVARRSQEEADRILAEARREAEEIRAEADEYVDSKLANFEVVLSKTVGSVERGREKLLGSGPGSEEWNAEYAEDAPERTTDPHELRKRADGYVDARLGSVSAVLTKTLEAVGRGRQKLQGHEPVDELAAHMAAQDGAGDRALHATDDEFLAGLSQQPQQAPPAEQQPVQVPQQHPQYAPAAEHQAPDPYYAQQPDPYAYQQQYYAPQQDPYYVQQPVAYQGDFAGYYEQQPAPQQYQQGGNQLDETSFFDTSMIDLAQVRQYEEQYDQRR
ncbi:hypothetical protein [Streptomyces sulphureus]|uniref:hypothetical protein n=1 Tax=Streptomyces sulphureus TaxID=47758 RepID=UPI000380431E|nr:hypothetical protein [Streptomyces sulphureus]